MMIKILTRHSLFAAAAAAAAQAAAPLPIDPLWKTRTFQRAFTGSYGIDSRIEPNVTAEEKAVLTKVAEEMAAGDRDGAIAALSGSPLLPGSAALQFSLGSLRFEEGETDAAVEALERAVELYPNFRDARRNLAVAFIRSEEFDKAEAHITRAVELGAQDGLTLGLLGYLRAQSDHPQAALNAYQLAQLTMPDEPQWMAGEAHALLELGQPEAAAAVFRDLIESSPARADYWIAHAEAAHKAGDPEDAIASLEIAERMGQLSPADTIALGHRHLAEMLPESALQHYLSAITAPEPADPQLALDALERLALTAKWDAAADLADAIAGAAPYEDAFDDSALRSRFDRTRALIEFESGATPDEAVKIVEALVASNPLDAPALILLAKFRARSGEPESAAMLLEQAAKVPAHEAEALRLHGQLLVDQRQFSDALPLLRQSHSLAPDPNLAAYIEAVEQLAARR